MKKICILTALFFCATFSYAADLDTVQSDKRYGMSSGIKLMNFTDYESEKDGTFYAASIPAGEKLIPLGSNDLLFFTKSSFDWGLSEFFFDFTLGVGLRYYPLGNNFLSVYGGGDAGTFFFNNLTLTGRVGADTDFKMNKDTSVYMGFEVFHRESYRVAEYINSEHWYISSKGWSINGGFRARFDLFRGGVKNVPKSL